MIQINRLMGIISRLWSAMTNVFSDEVSHANGSPLADWSLSESRLLMLFVSSDIAVRVDRAGAQKELKPLRIRFRTGRRSQVVHSSIRHTTWL